MRVLVTGAAGFIGSHVVRQIINEEHAVWAAVSPKSSTERLADILGRISIVPVDLRHHDGVLALVSQARPDCAIHLAWYTAPERYWTAPENLDCVAMTINFAKCLAEFGCPRLVAAGSCAEYDWDYGFLSESITPLRPSTLYGACKNATREILESLCKQAAMEFAWTRFFHLYGPGEVQGRLLPSVVAALLNGQSARCTDGKQLRDYLHVHDAASAVWTIAKSSLTGAVNVGSGEPVSVRAIVEKIVDLMQMDGRVVFGALPTNSEEPPLLLADIRRLKSCTGWAPGWELKEGLRQTIAWWWQKRENSNNYYGQTLEGFSGSS